MLKMYLSFNSHTQSIPPVKILFNGADISKFCYAANERTGVVECAITGKDLGKENIENFLIWSDVCSFKWDRRKYDNEIIAYGMRGKVEIIPIDGWTRSELEAICNA